MIGKVPRFVMTEENFSSVQRQIEDNLLQSGVEQEAVMRSSMLLEDICCRLFEHNSTQVQVEIHRRFGSVSLRLKSKGEAYDPLSEEKSWTDEDVDYYRDIVLKSNREWLGYSRSNGLNCLSIQVRRDKKKQV